MLRATSHPLTECSKYRSQLFWRCLDAPRDPIGVAPGTVRHYALSRYPGKSRPVGRNRELDPSKVYRFKRQSPIAQPSQQVGQQEQAFPEDDGFGRPPVSTEAAEEGLRRLLLNGNTLIVTRQLEMMDILIGFEQSNRYVIHTEHGEQVGFIVEQHGGFLSALSRQLFRTHRPFRALVLDTSGSPILWIRRPFAWINSRMFAQRLASESTAGEPVFDTFAEVQQRWHLWRRKYDLFLKDERRRVLSLASDPQTEPQPEEEDSFTQFAKVDQGFLAWNFWLRDERGHAVASINRAFRGFGREIFTETGQYHIHFRRPTELPPTLFQATDDDTWASRTLTLNERAVTLALAVDIDFDYFSKAQDGGIGMGPVFWTSGDWE